MDILNTKTYSFNLPEELIAQTPVEPRDSSRLLVCDRQTGGLEHNTFKNIADYLKSGDVLVVNNTKVLPARLFGKKADTGAKIELLLLKRQDLNNWEVLIKPVKRVQIGTIVVVSEELSFEVTKINNHGNCFVKFIYTGVFEQILNKVGQMPLPHYIKNKCENQRYNTVYSKVDGSSAAPTAGLHFTPELLTKLKDMGVTIVNVLLHVGLGTFRPVSTENILEHHMHTEYYEIDEHAASVINLAKQEGRRVIAVGTTSVRTLESAIQGKNALTACSGDTNIFIYPGYSFKIVDGIITNFHLPESTLIMLVSAFLGVDKTLSMYNTAVKEKYRFYSFGDSTLII